ncbi:MAG: SRPBCC family protein, partial [Hydrogenophaga sp.]|nr:SRPBCC family protein [Hydrogenophaga sp.]
HDRQGRSGVAHTQSGLQCGSACRAVLGRLAGQQRAAYMETCIEDDEIAERMDAGRKALLARGDNEVGPYQSPMENGMQHFHEWYRRQMRGAALD